MFCLSKIQFVVDSGSANLHNLHCKVDLKVSLSCVLVMLTTFSKPHSKSVQCNNNNNINNHNNNNHNNGTIQQEFIFKFCLTRALNVAPSILIHFETIYLKI